MVVHHSVRLKDVAADLAPKAHIRLGRIQLRLRLCLLVGLELIETILQHLHRRRLVLVLRSLRLRRRHDSARDMCQPHRRAGLVDVLAAGTRRAEHVHADVLVADLDVDLVVDDGVDERRRKAGMPARLRVERRDPHEPVHTRFRLEKAKGIHAFDLQHRALDPGFFPDAHVEDVNAVPLSLGPARIHAHQHLRPILGLGAARASADLELGVAEIVRSRQERPQAKGRELLAQHRRLALDFGAQLLVRLGGEHVLELRRALDARCDRVERIDPRLDGLDLLDDGLRTLLIVPEARCRHPVLETPQRIALGIQVKDTSAARPVARRAA